VTELFRDVFEARRARGLPAAVDAGEWGTLYRLAVNTRGLRSSDTVQLGDIIGF
jgi:hypothetical protein